MRCMDEFSGQLRVVKEAVEAEPKNGPQCKAALAQLTYVAGDDDVDVAMLNAAITQYDKKVERLQNAIASADTAAIQTEVDEWTFEPDHPSVVEAMALLSPPAAEEPAPAEAEAAAEGEAAEAPAEGVETAEA